MSKERLEEIKKELELDWSDISYVVNQNDVKWLVNRVGELEQQNKRYREALEEIARGRFPGASYKARKALEGESE